MVIIAACSSSAHQLLDLLSDRWFFSPFTACCPARLFRRQQCYSGDSAPQRYSASGSRLSDPAVRKARGNARRRLASSRQARLGCRYAPRPGSRARGSGWMASPAATRRSRLDLTARSLQPTQVRITGIPGACRSARVAITDPVYRVRTSPIPGENCADEPGEPGAAGETDEADAYSEVWVMGPPPGCSGDGAAGPAEEETAGSSAGTAASDLISMRQPVSLAASLAFCPSLPIASDSW